MIWAHSYYNGGNKREFFIGNCDKVIKLGVSQDKITLENLEAIQKLLANAETDIRCLLIEVDVLATQIDILNRENAKLKEHCEGWHTAAMRAGVALMEHIKEAGSK